MSMVFICSRGHRWVSYSPFSHQHEVTCPLCGSPSQTETKPTPNLSSPHPQEADEANESTRLSSQRPTPPENSKDMVEPIPSLEGFEIQEEIGRGGMGIVYRARQIDPNRLVAIKIIRNDRLTHADSVRRFRREAQAAARLAHPNLVTVLDSDHEGDSHYLVMEYVRGETLQRIVEGQGPLPVHLACEYIKQTARGLQHAWDQGLVHRDVKPSNLMVGSVEISSNDNARPTQDLVKILDMGVARLYQMSGSPAESLTTLTQPNAVLGTADFIAPEQLEDPHGADFRADFYSLGCTFYYLLTGQVPFRGGTLIQKLDRQRWETPASVDQLRKEIPPAIAAVVRKLMAKRPEDRYQNAVDFIRDLDLFLQTGRIGPAFQSLTIRDDVVFSGHREAVWCVALSADGKTALSGGKDRTIRLWDSEIGEELSRFEKNPNDVLSVTFSPQGNLFAGASGASIRLRETDSWKEVQRYQGHTDSVRGLCFTRDGNYLVSCGDDRTVRVWDVNTGRELLRFARHKEKVLGAAVSPDDCYVLSGGRGKKLRYWSLRNGQEALVLTTSSGQFLDLEISPDGLTALSVHFDTFVRVWDLQVGREYRCLKGHRQMVTTGVFLGNGKQILSGSKDQTIRLWDVSSGVEMAIFEGHEQGVTDLAVSPQADFFLSTAMDATIRKWPLPGLV